jgi:diadenylate cyclase
MELFDELRGILQRRVWTDLVEILIIGLAVHAAMRFLRGTRGARLLRGFVLLLVGSTLVVYLLANVLDLERIRVLYPFFVGSLFLVALVAFQPELRRALIKLGAAKWFPESSREIDRIIDEVVEAAASLSKNKIGGLIAFERSTEFGGLIESGCKLDAEVTKELLMTIFWPGSALHDMGVIISQGRLAAAAVQFPLTESTGLDSSMGSRHRSAIGLSQETDAVVLVVSEETGTISVVIEGKMQRFLTPETLRQVLRSELIQEPARKRRTLELARRS